MSSQVFAGHHSHKLVQEALGNPAKGRANGKPLRERRQMELARARPTEMPDVGCVEVCATIPFISRSH